MSWKQRLPSGVQGGVRRLRALWRRATGREGGWPPVGLVGFGSLRRAEPVSRRFGFDRGLPIDRFYIEEYLGQHARDVRGRVLEVGDRSYTSRFGGGHVTQSDVLHAVPGNPAATLVGRLDTGEGLPQGAFDCVILTQTLHCIYDIHAAVSTLAHILRPGGVVLASIPGISQISRYDADRWGDFWRLTPAAARRLFEGPFGSANVRVHVYGNVFAAAAFLYGLVREDLPEWALRKQDPDYPLVICIRATRI